MGTQAKPAYGNLNQCAQVPNRTYCINNLRKARQEPNACLVCHERTILESSIDLGHAIDETHGQRTLYQSEREVSGGTMTELHATLLELLYPMLHRSAHLHGNHCLLGHLQQRYPHICTDSDE